MALLLVISACQPPEARRRTGSSGADVGNRTPNVELHAGSRMYSRTPCLLPRELCPGPMPTSGLTTDYPQP
jgi:hypothetical protein